MTKQASRKGLHQIATYVDENKKRALKIIAAKEGRTVQSIIEEAVDRIVKEKYEQTKDLTQTLS